MDLAHLSSQGNEDGTSVKENIGHSYKEKIVLIQSLRNVNEFKKAFKVNFESYKIAQNQYSLPPTMF